MRHVKHKGEEPRFCKAAKEEGRVPGGRDRQPGHHSIQPNITQGWRTARNKITTKLESTRTTRSELPTLGFGSAPGSRSHPLIRDSLHWGTITAASLGICNALWTRTQLLLVGSAPFQLTRQEKLSADCCCKGKDSRKALCGHCAIPMPDEVSQMKD